MIGPVGSGKVVLFLFTTNWFLKLLNNSKSSLLLSLIDEMQKVSGRIHIKGSVFYVPQEPWIFTASFKQNILFGKPYDQKKFDKIVKICCLDEVNIYKCLFMICNLC